MGVRAVGVIIGVLAVVLIGAGCGGGSGGDDEATASASKDEFIRKADVICTNGGKEAQAELGDYAEENNLTESKEPSDAQYAEISRKIIIPALQRQVTEFRALGAPSGDEAEVEAIFDALDEAIGKAEDDPKAMAQEPTVLLADADKLLKEYGFKVCGNNQ